MTDWNAEYPLIDTGMAPKYFVSGLGRITSMGPVALFSFYVLRPRGDDQERMVEVELIAPVESVGPAFDMAVATLGAKAMVTLAGHAISRSVKRVLPM